MKNKCLIFILFSSFNVQAVDVTGLKDFLVKYANESEIIKSELKTKESSLNSLRKSNSTYLPSLNGYVQGSKTDSISDSSNSSSTDFRTQSYLKLTQNLYNGGSDQKTIEASKLDVVKAEQNVNKTYYEVLQTGLSNYFSLLKAKAEIENIKLEIEYNQKSLNELKRNLNNGLARKSQVKTLEVTLANNYVDQNSALNNYFKIKSSILGQSSLDVETFVSKVDLKDLETKTETKFELDLKNRADVQVLKINEEIKQKEIDISKSVKLPKLDLSASYYLSDTSKSNSQKDMYSAQLTLSIPFPFGDEKTVPIENSVNAKAIAQYQTKTLEKNLTVEFEGLKQDYKNAILQVNALKSAYELSEKNAENLKSDFRSGLVSYGEYLTASTTFQQIKRKLDQSKIEKLFLEEKLKLWIHGVEGYLK